MFKKNVKRDDINENKNLKLFFYLFCLYIFFLFLNLKLICSLYFFFFFYFICLFYKNNNVTLSKYKIHYISKWIKESHSIAIFLCVCMDYDNTKWKKKICFFFDHWYNIKLISQNMNIILFLFSLANSNSCFNK